MRAILSVSDKSGLIPFARGLVTLGFQLVSTGGTAKAIAEAGLAVTNVSEVTGFPEMMDGRVKTLHPKLHGGILARRNRPDDLEAAKIWNIELVDIVVVNLYPFAKAAANPETPFDELIEQIDIGGPSLLRAAGKNFRDVLVVVDPADYADVLDELVMESGVSLEFRFGLMRKAFRHTAEFDALISQTLELIELSGAEFSRKPVPALINMRYGENPHQKANCQPSPFVFWKQHQGKDLSYTNLLDLDAAARLVLEFEEPAAVIIKHTNPCAASTAKTIAEAYKKARNTDPLSAFGGIVGLNRAIDFELALMLTETFIECVVTTSVEEAALEVLAKKPNLRVVTLDFVQARLALANEQDVRNTLFGVLFEDRDVVVEAHHPWPDAEKWPEMKVVTKRQPTQEEWTALRFAWRICAHAKSNTIVFTGADEMLALGAGQMSRVDSVKVAVMKAAARMAGDEPNPIDLHGSVVASDAFFPFRDGLDACVDAGANAIVQPGGSVKDADVIAAADERGIAMVFTGRRHFRH